jgi:hypothetical protein
MLTNLGSSQHCSIYLVSLILIISSIIIIQAELLVVLVEAQQEQGNKNTTTATDLTKMRNNAIIPQAQDINESNL